jgi:hypothetical protein
VVCWHSAQLSGARWSATGNVAVLLPLPHSLTHRARAHTASSPLAPIKVKVCVKKVIGSWILAPQQGGSYCRAQRLGCGVRLGARRFSQRAQLTQRQSGTWTGQMQIQAERGGRLMGLGKHVSDKPPPSPWNGAIWGTPLQMEVMHTIDHTAHARRRYSRSSYTRRVSICRCRPCFHLPSFIRDVGIYT